jgi:hypothetical protein
VAAEQMKTPGMPVLYGSSARRGRIKTCVGVFAPVMMSPPTRFGVTGRDLGGRLHGGSDDPLAQPRSEALDLIDQQLPGVTVVAVWDVRVGPHRMDVPEGASGIRQVLLGNEHERPLRQPAAVDVALRGDYLLE